MDVEIDYPILERLRIDFGRAVRKGGQRALKIILVRTKAGRAADGSRLPLPKSRAGVYGPVNAPLNRTGEMLDALKVFKVVRLKVKVAPDGFHSAGKAGRTVGALERAKGKKLTRAARQKLARAAGAALKNRKGAGGRGGKKGGATPNPVVMYSQQAGAVGGKKAGHRPAFEVMALSTTEESEVHEVMAGDVLTQVQDLESSGSVFDFRNVRKVLDGRR